MPNIPDVMSASKIPHQKLNFWGPSDDVSLIFLARLSAEVRDDRTKTGDNRQRLFSIAFHYNTTTHRLTTTTRDQFIIIITIVIIIIIIIMSNSTNDAVDISKDNVDKKKKNKNKKTTVTTTAVESTARPSISVRMIRHAESFNNEVYRNARYIYRGGTPDFDLEGWTAYVNAHRSADPSLSATGKQQAEKLADFLVPHLQHQASYPVRIITSPMRRTLETIRPTIQRLEQSLLSSSSSDDSPAAVCQIVVNGFYFESEGCHTHDKPEEGMNPKQIRNILEQQQQHQQQQPSETTTNDDNNNNKVPHSKLSIDFVGFDDDDPNRGWYYHGTGAETRAASETRAAKFYLWLCEYLDAQLILAQQQQQHGGGDDPFSSEDDLFDAGVAMPGEEHEDEHDKYAPRQRKRRTALLMGHGDFMSLVLKRIVAGFGHYVEATGVPHRSAFTHFNTGMTELEYFGHGRWLVMSHNQTPHLTAAEYSTLRTGGSLKDGWSYLVPSDEVLLNAEVSVAFSDEDLEEHIREQAAALKALYLSSERSDLLPRPSDQSLSVEDDSNTADAAAAAARKHATQKDNVDETVKHFIVKRGLQVVGVATYSEHTGQLTDVAVRPSAGKEVSEALFAAVKEHSKRLGRSGSLLVKPRCDESKRLFQELGFEEVEGSELEHLELAI